MQVTVKDLELLKEDLKRLETVGRKAILAELSHMREEEPHFAENGAYIHQLNLLHALEVQIDSLHNSIMSAEIVENACCVNVVGVGTLLEVVDEDGEVIKLEVVSDGLSKPLEWKVSMSSPIVKACLETKENGTFEVVTSMGVTVYKLQKIDYKR